MTEEQAVAQVEKGLPPAVAASAAQAKAEIEAAYTIAKRFNRDYDEVRVRVLKTCSRPAFAGDKSAVYLKPVGGGAKVEGPGIRLAEELARQMGNMRAVCALIHEDDESQLYTVSAVDLETNATFATTIAVKKVIERHSVRTGQQIVGKRTTSKGEQVFIIRPTAEELVTKANALISKALRNQILRCIPQDIVEEAVTTIKKTRQDSAAKDPDKARKDLADAFAALNVSPAQLKDYTGCGLEQLSPAQLDDLRSIYGAIRDGETTWQEIVASKQAKAQAEAGGPETGELKMEDLKPGEAPPEPVAKPSNPKRGRPRKKKEPEPAAAEQPPEQPPVEPAEAAFELKDIPAQDQQRDGNWAQLYSVVEAGIPTWMVDVDGKHMLFRCDCKVWTEQQPCRHVLKAQARFLQTEEQE